MNYRILFFLFFFGLIGSTTTSFAQEQLLREYDVYQGSELTFQINSSFGAPIPLDPPIAGSSIDFLFVNGDDYYYKYTPDPSHLGADGFSFQVITDPFPPDISYLNHVFQIQVIASVVNTNDDFMYITPDDDMIINVLANDETSSTNPSVSIAQVLRGTAVVNEDETITYTPPSDSDDPDYIIYTVSDEFNTIADAIVYLAYEAEITEDLTVKKYKIASGKSQYIVLPNEDFTLNSESYDYGSVELVNDFVYKYICDSSVEGNEEVNFTDSNGNTYRAEITIIEKYEDVGFVRDDLIYCAPNTSIEFDVTLNDIEDQYVISEYSPELIHQGAGVFTYTPPPYFTGVKTFSYTADNGFTEESGTIELIFNKFNPTNYFEYNLSTPQNQPRIIEYDVPLGTEYFEIASLPTYGSIEIFNEDESVDVSCEEGLQKVFAVYTPDTDYVGLDDLTIRYCASDNNVCTDVNITFDVIDNDLDDCICVDDCVWAGDANGDGKVSVLDALSVGRFIGSGGAPRDDSPFGASYEGVSVDDWLEEQVNGKNVKHADANGDGFVTTEDLDVVLDNYGQINSIISNDILGIKNVPFLLSTTVSQVDSGEWLVIYVTIGSQAYPAIDIQGVSFAVNLSPDLVDSSSVEVEYLETGYLVKDAPYVSMTHQPSDGIIHTAGLKTNSLGSTGSGIVATVSFIVEEDALGIKENHRSSTSSNGEDKVVTIYANDIVIEDSRGFKYALPNTSLDIVVKSGEEKKETIEHLDIYPNPSSDRVAISSDNGAILKSINIYSVDGKLMKTINQIDSNEALIEVNDLEDGLYIIKAFGESNTYTTKLIKK